MRQNFGTLVIFGLFCIAGVAVAGKLNDTLATNKHEGDTLMVEIDAFLGDEAVPQKLKVSVHSFSETKTDIQAIVRSSQTYAASPKRYRTHCDKR